MDNMVKTFVNEEFGSVRTIEENGKILFCGSDVAKALGYRRPKDAINAHCKGGCKTPPPYKWRCTGNENDIRR